MINKVDVSKQAKRTSLYLQKFDAPMNSDLKVTFTADIQSKFDALWMMVTNADAHDERFEGTRNSDGTWTVKVPASHFAHYGFIKQGARVWVTIDGSDYCVAFADVDVLPDNPCAIIGQGTYQELRIALTGLSDKVEQFDGRISDLEASIDGISEAVSVVDGKVTTLTEDMTEVQSTVSSHSITLAGQAEQIASLESQSSELGEEIQNLDSTKRDIDDRTWVKKDYWQDAPRYGIDHFTINGLTTTTFDIVEGFSRWKYSDTQQVLAVMTSDGLHFAINDSHEDIVWFLREDKDTTHWDGMSYQGTDYVVDAVLETSRLTIEEDMPSRTSQLENDSGFPTEQNPGKFVRWYNQDGDPNRRYINIGADSIGGIGIYTDSEHPENTYINIAGNKLLSGTLPVERTAQKKSMLFSRAAVDENARLKYNEDFIPVMADVPKNTSDLTNDSEFIDSSALDPILEKIPQQATAQNQLADKNFVNSSIGTNTANFKGTFNSTSELPTTGATNNDYAFVVGTDSAGNTQYNRYKYNGSAWVFEYVLNNSSFTAQQWATINGGPYASEDDIPTKTSDLNNDSGFITEGDIPEIPTKTSDLTNDSGFLTSDDVSSKRDITDMKVYPAIEWKLVGAPEGVTFTSGYPAFSEIFNLWEMILSDGSRWMSATDEIPSNDWFHAGGESASYTPSTIHNYHDTLATNDGVDAKVDTAIGGKIDNPATKSEGQFLRYNGTNWVAGDASTTTIRTWSGN